MLAVYITGHGFGHAARTCDVLAAYRRHYPEVPVTVVADLPEWFIQSRLPGVAQRQKTFDVGIVQHDAVRMDLSSTLQRLEVLSRSWDGLVAQERRWQEENGVSLVVADIPAIPLQAASCPSVALTSFSWDWIYEEFEGWESHVERFAQAYRCCGTLLRYPFSAPMANLGEAVDVPLVASPGRSVRDELAAETGADPSKLWCLFSFAGLEFENEGALGRFPGVEFFTTGSISGCFEVSQSNYGFNDLVASVDAVITKPGFGILSDCAANDTAIIYVEREGFREYPILETCVKRHLRHVHLPLAKLYRGELGEVLEELPDLPPVVEALEVDGATFVAGLLHRLRSSTAN